MRTEQKYASQLIQQETGHGAGRSFVSSVFKIELAKHREMCLAGLTQKKRNNTVNYK